ncbi:unnamed protein product [Closterium sp. Naga37s-1]|nr:unnamed protein product [Closterium sp. Naga37s-1]
MVLEALIHANHKFRFGEIAESKDLDRFCELDDTILRDIVRSRNPSLKKSQEILKQIERRQLYQYMNEFVVPVDALHHFKQLTVAEYINEFVVPVEALPHFRKLTVAELLRHACEFVVVPVDALQHFRKLTVDELLRHLDAVHHFKKLSVNELLRHGTGSYLREHGDQVIVDNIKIDYGQDINNPLDKAHFFDEDEVKEAFVNYQMQTFGREVMRTPSRKRMRRHHENGGGITNGGGTGTELTGDDDDVVSSQTARKLM